MFRAENTSNFKLKDLTSWLHPIKLVAYFCTILKYNKSHWKNPNIFIQFTFIQKYALGMQAPWLCFCVFLDMIKGHQKNNEIEKAFVRTKEYVWGQNKF